MNEAAIGTVVGLWSLGMAAVAGATWVFESMKHRPFNQAILPIMMSSVVGTQFESGVRHGWAMLLLVFAIFATAFAVMYFPRWRLASAAFASAALCILMSFFHGPLVLSALLAGAYLTLGSGFAIRVVLATVRPVTQPS